MSQEAIHVIALEQDMKGTNVRQTSMNVKMGIHVAMDVCAKTFLALIIVVIVSTFPLYNHTH